VIPSVDLMRRKLWQISSTILHNAYFPGFLGIRLYEGFLKGFCTPTLNCYSCPAAFLSCPVGALQNFIAMRMFPFFVVGFVGLVGAGVGRMTCGWLCPFGLLQDVMKKASSRVIRLPRWMGNLKYGSLLIVAILLPLFLMEPWFCKLCPAGGLEGAIPWAAAGAAGARAVAGLAIGSFFWVKMAILAFFLLAMVFVKRPFCRTFCPLGALFSLFNKISLVRLHVDMEACNQCGLCQEVCPVDLTAYLEVDSPECIKCLECTKCPNQAITVRFGVGGGG
jgi:ferredoxin-type protein NapH